LYICRQSYTSIPKIISRNCNYIFVFKVNDKVSIKRIISNHGLSSVLEPEMIGKYYYYATAKPLGFLLIDRSGYNEF
jgi:hypothetical protein